MAALTATDWTVSVERKNSPGGTKTKMYECKLTLATTGTYGSGGIPIPTRQQFGFVRNLDYINVLDQLASSASMIVKYDKLAGTIRLYTTTASSGTSIAELATTITAGSGSFVIYVEAVGW